jgi:hypothetical protein
MFGSPSLNFKADVLGVTGDALFAEGETPLFHTRILSG